MAGRSTPRRIDDAPDWARRKFREQDQRIAALEDGKADVPGGGGGSTITIEQVINNPAGTTGFLNTDTATAAADDTAVTITLTHVPLPGSEHVRQNGNTLLTTEWSRAGDVVTIEPDTEVVIRVDDVFEVAYAYDGLGGAPIVSEPQTLIPFTTSGWRYLQVALADAVNYSAVSFDDTGWSLGSTMFGNGVGSGAGAATNWDEDTSLWVRKTFPRSQDVTVTVAVEDGCDVYVNGILVGSSGIAGVGSHHVSPPFTVVVSNDLTNSGVNTLAIRANDEAGGSSDEASLDIEVTGRLVSV